MKEPAELNQWIKNIKETGSREDFDKLVAEFQSYAIHAAKTITRDQTIVEDAVADMWLNLWNSRLLRCDSTKGPFEGWLRRQVTSKVINLIRYAGFRTAKYKHFFDYHQGDVIGSKQSRTVIYNNIIHSDAYKELEKEMVKLSQIHREVLIYIGLGYNQSDISKLLNVPKQTIQKRIAVAKQRLRETEIGIELSEK